MSTNESGESSGAVGELGKSGAQWVSNNASELIEHLPRPGARWAWGDTAVSHASLMKMKTEGWIFRDGDWWRTPRSTVRHAASYGRVPMSEVGVEVLELVDDVDAVRVIAHVPVSGRSWRRGECGLTDDELRVLVERGLVKELGDGDYRTPEKTVAMAERCVDGDPGQLSLDVYR